MSSVEFTTEHKLGFWKGVCFSLAFLALLFFILMLVAAHESSTPAQKAPVSSSEKPNG